MRVGRGGEEFARCGVFEEDGHGDVFAAVCCDGFGFGDGIVVVVVVVVGTRVRVRRDNRGGGLEDAEARRKDLAGGVGRPGRGGMAFVGGEGRDGVDVDPGAEGEDPLDRV